MSYSKSDLLLLERDVAKRIAVEQKIFKRCVKDLIKAGYRISLYDGEETTVLRSIDSSAIIAASMTTDEDYLFVHTQTDNKRIGWVFFVYGNDGWDVINDYTVNLEPVLKGICDYAETFDK